ncbi:MAG: hypothetical protein ACTSUU_00095, partial [Candidatus Thorarchaeota archaeon]
MIDTVPPTAPSPYDVIQDTGWSDPYENTVTNDTTPKFKWYEANDSSDSPTGEAAGIRYYEVIADDDLIPPYLENVKTENSEVLEAYLTLTEGKWKWVVRAWDWAGNYTDSALGDLTIDLTAVPPSPLSPENGAYLNYTTVVLDWSDENENSDNTLPLIAYRFQVDNDPTFDLDDLNDEEGGSSRETKTDSLPSQKTKVFASPADEKYYWRVRLQDGAATWSPWSGVYWFIIDTVPPLPASKGTPKNDENNRNPTITFTWSKAEDNDALTDDVSGVNYYRLQIDDDPSFNSVNYQVDISYPNTSTSLTLPDNIWYWRVITVDNAGNVSTYETPWMFTVDNTPPAAPTLISPAPNAKTNDNTPRFEWSEVWDLTGVTYEIWIDNDPDFDNSGGHLIIENTDNTWFVWSSEFSDELYYWWVRCWDGKNWSAPRENGPFSETRTVLIDTVPPTVPSSSPQYQDKDGYWWAGDGIFFTDNTETDRKLRVHWENSTDFSNSPTGEVAGIQYYELWIDNDNTFTSPENSDYTYYAFSPDNKFDGNDDNHPKKTGTTVLDETYYYRVRVWDWAGNASDWSPTWKFYVDTVPPTPPTNLWPDNDAALNSGEITHQWDPSFDTSGIKEYRINIATDPEFTSTLVNELTSTTSFYQDYDSIGGDGRYYWRVRAYDIAEPESNVGDWSVTHTLVIDRVPPFAPENLHTPENNHVGSDQAPTFSWSAAQDNTDLTSEVAGVENYILQLDNDPDFSSPDNFIVHLDNWFTLPDENTLDVGDWYWRVWTVDRAGNMSEQPSDTFKVRINDLTISLEVDPNDNVVNPGEGVDIWGRASWQPDNLSVKNTQV